MSNGAAERALVDVVAEANGLTGVDPADSYVLAGGRVLRLPRVLDALAERGWHGVSMDHLISPRPLRELAGQLTTDH
jgi:hypothetical protein